MTHFSLDTESETDSTSDSIVSYHSTMTDVAMSVDQTARRAEIKIGQPIAFDEAADKANRWILSADAYLQLNAHIYTTDEMKILFALSFCTEGHAAQWAESIYTKYTTDPYPT